MGKLIFLNELFKIIFATKTIGLLINQQDKDYNYLAYNINIAIGNIKVSPAEYNNHPLCEINIHTHSKSTSFYSFYYNKDERNKEIASISKKPNLFAIKYEDSENSYWFNFVNICIDSGDKNKTINRVIFIKKIIIKHKINYL